jgi:hypothetical protein
MPGHEIVLVEDEPGQFLLADFLVRDQAGDENGVLKHP